MSLENPAAPVERKFIPNKNESMLDQLKAFNPGKSVDFTALKYLTNPEDIKKYFDESVALKKTSMSENQIPAETVRSNLAHIAGYGEEYKKGWEIFKTVLSEEFEKGIKEAQKISENKFNKN